MPVNLSPSVAIYDCLCYPCCIKYNKGRDICKQNIRRLSSPAILAALLQCSGKSLPS
nr:MAG TPA: glycoprotein [Caudoviricetes sp.]